MGRMTASAEPSVAPHNWRRGRASIGGDVDRRHRAPLLPYVLRGDILTILTAPIIYSLIVPFVIIDLWVSGYINGLIAYVREVAARTEQYWCPIRDGRRGRGRHGRYAGFAPYGDGAAYRAMLPSLRAKLKK